MSIDSSLSGSVRGTDLSDPGAAHGMIDSGAVSAPTTDDTVALPWSAQREMQIRDLLAGLDVAVNDDMILAIARRRMEDLDHQVGQLTSQIEGNTELAHEQAAGVADLRRLQEHASQLHAGERGNYDPNSAKPAGWTPPSDWDRPPGLTDDEAWQRFRDDTIAELNTRGIHPNRDDIQHAVDAGNEVCATPTAATSSR